MGYHALLQGNLLNPGIEPESPAWQSDSLLRWTCCHDKQLTLWFWSCNDIPLLNNPGLGSFIRILPKWWQFVSHKRKICFSAGTGIQAEILRAHTRDIARRELRLSIGVLQANTPFEKQSRKGIRAAGPVVAAWSPGFQAKRSSPRWITQVKQTSEIATPHVSANRVSYQSHPPLKDLIYFSNLVKQWPFYTASE